MQKNIVDDVDDLDKTNKLNKKKKNLKATPGITRTRKQLNLSVKTNKNNTSNKRKISLVTGKKIIEEY